MYVLVFLAEWIDAFTENRSLLKVIEDHMLFLIPKSFLHSSVMF